MDAGVAAAPASSQLQSLARPPLSPQVQETPASKHLHRNLLLSHHHQMARHFASTWAPAQPCQAPSLSLSVYKRAPIIWSLHSQQQIHLPQECQLFQLF